MKTIQKTEPRKLVRANAITRPSGKVLASLIKVTDSFFSTFTTTFLEQKTGICNSTIRNYKHRKQISQEAATAFCKIKEVKAAGFTREKLRPDLRAVDWVAK
jgi:hypothetical protein